MRVFPFPTGPKRDVWQYIREQNIPIVPLYYAQQRKSCSAEPTGFQSIPSRCSRRRNRVTEWVRFRTLGCMPCTGAVKSEAPTSTTSSKKQLIATRSERETRVIDHGANTMEDKKREGYF